MRLLLDENCARRELQQRLRTAGHDVESTLEVLGAGVSDLTIAAYASSERRVVVSKDTADFARLYAGHGEHPGALLIFEDSAPRRMTAEAIVRAMRHVETTYACIDGMILALNDFQS